MVAVLAVLATIPVSPSRADFGSPFRLSGSGNAAGSRVTVDADGDMLFAWRIEDAVSGFRVQARPRSAGGVLGSILNLSRASDRTSHPELAMNPDGASLTAWSRLDGNQFIDRVQARARSAAGVLGALQPVSPSGLEGLSPRVAIDAEGDAVFAWIGRDASGQQEIRARSRSAAGTLGSVQTLSIPVTALVFEPSLAGSGDGRTVAVWVDIQQGSFGVRARTRSAAGVLGPIHDLAPGYSQTPGLFDYQVAIDTDGDAYAVWGEDNGSTERRINGRAISAAGVLGPIQILSPPGRVASWPQVAFDDAGNALIVWYSRNSTSGLIQARTRSAAGALGQVRNIATAPCCVFMRPALALNGGGDAVIAWYRRATDFQQSGLPVSARTRAADGTLGPVQTLSTRGAAAGPSPDIGSAPGAALNEAGVAAVVWEEDDSFGRNRATAAVGP